MPIYKLHLNYTPICIIFYFLSQNDLLKTAKQILLGLQPRILEGPLQNLNVCLLCPF